MCSPISSVIRADDRRQLGLDPGDDGVLRAGGGRSRQSRGCSRRMISSTMLGHVRLEDRRRCARRSGRARAAGRTPPACRAWRSPCRRRCCPSSRRGPGRSPASRCRPAGARDLLDLARQHPRRAARMPGMRDAVEAHRREQHDQAGPVDQPADHAGEERDGDEVQPVHTVRPTRPAAPWSPLGSTPPGRSNRERLAVDLTMATLVKRPVTSEGISVAAAVESAPSTADRHGLPDPGPDGDCEDARGRPAEPELTADCSRCFALCCVLLPYRRDAGFGADKPGGVACHHLARGRPLRDPRRPARAGLVRGARSSTASGPASTSPR